MELQEKVSGTQHISVPKLKSNEPSNLLKPETHRNTAVESNASAAVANLPTVSASKTVLLDREPFPNNLPGKLGLVLGQNGTAYAVMKDAGNHYALAVGSRKLDAIIVEAGRSEGRKLRKAELGEINHFLLSQAELAGKSGDVWYRVAPIEGGVEIDLGDEDHVRVRVTAGRVDIVRSGSTTLFYRTRTSKQMALPADTGDLGLLNKYLNLHPADALLFTAWLSYTLAHPKAPATKYPILVLQGSEGTGKTSLCQNIIQRLIDPSEIGVQVMPNTARDLAIAGQNAHVLCFDNLRDFRQGMADMLCIAATGGAFSSRQLYTDADQQVTRLHVAMVLNGIHSFIDQPDLAQRCLVLPMRPLAAENRKPEAVMIREFEADLPNILRGLFDLIAAVLKHLPTVQVTNPERMIDFVYWLAGMERAHGLPTPFYQREFSSVLRQGQLDTLMDNPLAAAILEFTEDLDNESWSGTPTELLAKLNSLVTTGTQRSREWPQNSIALSRRIAPLQAGLLSQGIKVELTRGKHRTVNLSKIGD